MVELSDMSKFTEGSWPESFTVNNERAVLAWVGRKRRPKTWDPNTKTSLKITYKYLETDISTLDV